MIILKVKDSETDDDDLELPEWMNVNVPDIDSDGSEASTYVTWESPTISSEEEISSIASSEDDDRDPDEVQNDDDPENADDLSDNAVSSLSDDMDTSDDEETAVARSCLYWYLCEKGYFAFPPSTDRNIDSEAKATDMESTSGINEKSKITGDPSSTEKSDATKPDETTVEKSTPLDG